MEGRGLSELIDRARRAAQRAIDEAKDTGQRVTFTRRRAALAEQLGDAVYRQREGEAGLEIEIDRLVEEMRVVGTEIAMLADD